MQRWTLRTCSVVDKSAALTSSFCDETDWWAVVVTDKFSENATSLISCSGGETNEEFKCSECGVDTTEEGCDESDDDNGDDEGKGSLESTWKMSESEMNTSSPLPLLLVSLSSSERSSLLVNVVVVLCTHSTEVSPNTVSMVLRSTSWWISRCWDDDDDESEDDWSWIEDEHHRVEEVAVETEMSAMSFFTTLSVRYSTASSLSTRSLRS